MRQRFFQNIAIALVLIFSSGCAFNVAHTPFKRDAGNPVRSIAVLSVQNPVMTSVHNYGSLSGGLGAAASQSKYQEPLTKLLDNAGFDFGKEMHAAIVSRLERAGYRILPVNFERENNGKLLDDYKKLPTTGADAVLDVATGALFGYANVDILDQEYRPYIIFSVRLVSSKTREPLYAEAIIYGWTNMFMSATQLKAPEKYFYAEADRIIANKSNTAEGLRAGINSIADHLVAQLNP